VLAQEEARLLNHNFIGTEHILLGLLDEGDGVATRALASLNIGLEAARERVQYVIGPTGSSAEGVVAGTTRWTLRVRGDDDDYSTMLGIEDQSGPISGGGMGGPKLWNDDLMNVYSGRDDDGPLAIVVRTDPSIVRMVLVTQAGVERDLAPCGAGPIDGLRFYIGFAWPANAGAAEETQLGFTKSGGLDAEGIVRETYDLTFWNAMP
jgi:hypothetical protein